MLEDLHFLLLLCDFRDHREGETRDARHTVSKARRAEFFTRSNTFARLPFAPKFFVAVRTGD